jgi:hypothetical protein
MLRRSREREAKFATVPDTWARRLLRLEQTPSASKHFQRTGHPVMRSVEPGENWRWCYIDARLR